MTFTEDEVKLSLAMMTYWSNMAKSGNPNTPGSCLSAHPTAPSAAYGDL